MALLDTAPRAPLAPLSGALHPRTLLARLASWQERRATRATLMQLSDAELDDIGLTRGEIERRFG